MKPYHSQNGHTIYQGHVLEMLSGMTAESVQCVVTSPPYWGLRDYGLEPQVWDENECVFDQDCEHEWGEEKLKQVTPISEKTGLHNDGRKIQVTEKYRETLDAMTPPASQGQFCLKCNAWHGSLGLEPTPELFISHLVQIFREVKRVMKPSACIFLNLGDSYAGGGRASGKKLDDNGIPIYDTDLQRGNKGSHVMPSKIPSGLKPKDLCGIPWRIALALQADGFLLRSDIIWSKPNPMPESVRDRPTRSHEYVFLLTKSAKYYWDQEVVREPNSPTSGKWGKSVITKTAKVQGKHGKTSFMAREMPNKEVVDKYYTKGRNIRSVWTIATQPFTGAHFATFPEKLVETCIKAGSRIGDTILDPFGGAMTVAVVSQKLNRKSVSIELKTEYCDMGIKRLGEQGAFDFK